MAGHPIVIAGGGPAAVAAAGAARDAGYAGRVVLISDEAELPYRRPPLSKDYLTGDSDAASLAVRPAAWFDENGVELMLGCRVDALDVSRNSVRLNDGARMEFSSLLIATGGRPRRFPGLDHERVVHLRTMADSDVLMKRLRQGEPLVVLGAGFVGCEVAASARKLGVEVTVLELADVPLRRAIGDRFGAIVGEVHREAGVDLRTGEGVESVTPTRDGLLVTTSRGRIECGLLLVAMGLEPNVELAGDLLCDNGILVDSACRTSAPTVFAAGDVAAHRHPLYGRHVRVEHYDNALKQGAVAGHNMVATEPRTYAEPHWFWSDQYEHSLQYLGLPDPSAPVVVRGSVESRQFSAWTISAGVVSSVFTMNRTKDVVAAKRLIATRTQVTAAQLADESTDLRRMGR
jgi:3-phenylpropionate/trans-cinnamate dioxygenase ferredoxin reductase component